MTKLRPSTTAGLELGRPAFRDERDVARWIAATCGGSADAVLRSRSSSTGRRPTSSTEPLERVRARVAAALDAPARRPARPTTSARPTTTPAAARAARFEKQLRR